MRKRAGLAGLMAFSLAVACGSGSLTDAERAWCVEHHQTVVDTMDLLFPYHWEGNEAAKEETLPIFQQLEEGAIEPQEANALLTEIIRRYWPEEYEQGCRAAYEDA